MRLIKTAQDFQCSCLVHRLLIPKGGRRLKAHRSHPPARPYLSSGSAPGAATRQAAHLPLSTQMGSSTLPEEKPCNAVPSPCPRASRSRFIALFPLWRCSLAARQHNNTPEFSLSSDAAEPYQGPSPPQENEGPLPPESYHHISKQLCSAGISSGRAKRHPNPRGCFSLKQRDAGS